MKRFFPFGVFARDSSDYDTPHLDEARMVIPVHGIYRPIREAQTVATIKFADALTPWIHFDGTAEGKVDFDSNLFTGESFVAIRFRTEVAQNAVLAGAGLTTILGGAETGIGANLGLASNGAAIAGLAFGDPGSTNPSLIRRVVRSLPGGYADGEWHIAVSWSRFGSSGGNFVHQMKVMIDGFESPVNQVVFEGNANNFDSQPGRWGMGSTGSHRFTGDIERVLSLFNGQVPATGPGKHRGHTWEEIKAMMAAPMDAMSSGGWGGGSLWLLRENTGVTVFDFGSVGPLDGTMDTGVTWEGDDFPTDLLSESGITGGHAHFYTRDQSALDRGPVGDIDRELWRQFGSVDHDEQDGFPQLGPILADRLNEKVPDDSNGAILGVPPQGLTSPQTFIVRMDDDTPDPGTDDGHILAYRYRFNGKANADGDQPVDSSNLQLGLYQFDTLIAELPKVETTAPDEEWHHVAYEIPTLEAAEITNYSALRVRATGEMINADRQAGFPVADLINTDGWKRENGNLTGLWQSINDPFLPGDDTFAESNGIAPGGTSRYRFKLTNSLEDPRNPNGFNIVVRLEAVDPGLDAVVRLLESGVEIFRRVLTDIPAGPSNRTLVVPIFDAEKIADFSKLSMEVVFRAHGSPGPPGSGGLFPTAFDGPVINTVGNATALREAGGPAVSTGPAGGRFRTVIDAGTNPGTTQDHRIRMRASRTGNAVGASVQLSLGGTTLFDSRDADGPGGRPLPTTTEEIVFPIPAAAAQQISSYSGLKVQVITHSTPTGGTANYDLLSLEYPGSGTGGRRGRLYSAVLGLPSRAWIGVSWVRLFLPDPDNNERSDVTELYAGNYRNLYVVDDAGFSEVSRATRYAGSSTPRSWDFTSFGANIIATNKVDPVQVRAPGDALFSDLITSVPKPQFATICAVQRHLIGANVAYVDTGQGSGPDGFADEWWCSAFDDPEDFEISLATGSNRGRTQETEGEIVKAVGGEMALLFKRDSIQRLDWVGPPGTFRPDVVSVTDGTIFPRSVVQRGRDAYFLDQDGFKVVLAGQRVDASIGVGFVNRMITDTAFERRAVQPIDSDQIPQAESVIFGAYDHLTGLVWWCVRARDDGGAANLLWRNKLFVTYNPSDGRWAVIEEEGEVGDLTATHLWGLPSQVEASTSIARGIGMVTLDDEFPVAFNYRFRRFLSGRLYSSTFKTKIWSSQFIHGEVGKELLINFVRPSFRMAPESTARPDVEVTVTAADDPLMQFDVQEETRALEDANEDMWYPFGISGEYFQIEVRFPRLQDQTIREIRGVEIDYKLVGEF